MIGSWKMFVRAQTLMVFAYVRSLQTLAESCMHIGPTSDAQAPTHSPTGRTHGRRVEFVPVLVNTITSRLPLSSEKT